MQDRNADRLEVSRGESDHDHNQRSLTGDVAAFRDQQAVVGEIVAWISGFGSARTSRDDPMAEGVVASERNRSTSPEE